MSDVNNSPSGIKLIESVHLGEYGDIVFYLPEVSEEMETDPPDFSIDHPKSLYDPIFFNPGLSSRYLDFFKPFMGVDWFKPWESVDISNDPQQLEVPKDENGFVINLPPLAEDIGSAPRFKRENIMGNPLCMEHKDMDPGFVRYPPYIPGGMEAVPMPSHYVIFPGPDPDPCFNPCSPECLNK